MKTFEQFVAESAAHGSINPIFESGMHMLLNDLEGIVTALRDAGVRFEVVDGVAVNAHIFSLHRSRSFVTRDIDVLIRRNGLERAPKAAEPLGVHLLFVGEKSKSTQPSPHPELHPEQKYLFDMTIPVAPLKDLVHMKLNSLRPKDIIHLETLDEVGLITRHWKENCHPRMQERLREARKEIAENKPDVEG
jgi:hypothetical protein